MKIGTEVEWVKGWCTKFPECTCGLGTVYGRMVWAAGAQRDAKGKFWVLIFPVQKSRNLCLRIKAELHPRRFLLTDTVIPKIFAS